MDREGVANRLMELAPLVRRRVRDKLSPAGRRLFDTQDLLSTVLRRVDRLLCEGRLRATTDAELVGLVVRMLDNAIIDRQRVLGRLQRIDGADGEWARRLKGRFDGADAVLADVFEALTREDDRLYLSLWLRGAPHSSISYVLGIAPDAARQRWVAIRRRISSALDTTYA
ncbi:MAG: hypothetical protein AAGF47_06845 [Planctomycetota bacterium]